MSADDGLEPLPASLARTWGNTETMEGRMSKLHYQLQEGRWRCRDMFGDWWWMPTFWRPGMSVEGFVMR